MSHELLLERIDLQFKLDCCRHVDTLIRSVAESAEEDREDDTVLAMYDLDEIWQIVQELIAKGIAEKNAKWRDD